MKKELVEVYKARGETQAEIIRSLLESNDIPSILRSNAAPSAFQFTIDGMGEYKVMVWEEDAEDAKKIIENNEAQIE